MGVLRGGPSAEYDISLQTGSAVLRNLPDEYEGVDVFIDKSGAWHRGGLALSPYQALQNVDVVWNGLHGEYGEDGKVQRELQILGVPYTGSSSLSAALSMNKMMAKERFKKEGLHVPEALILSVDHDIDEKLFDVFSRAVLPVIVKPQSSGSSLGVTLARSLDDIERGVRKAFAYSSGVIIEEYIPGKEATVGVVEGLRNQDLYALSPVEITHTERPFFDYDAKYKGRALEICPGNFSDADKRTLIEMAKVAHQVLGLRHYSRSDFVVSPGKGIFILETNALPSLLPDSSMSRALGAAAITTKDFLRHVLSLALEKN